MRDCLLHAQPDLQRVRSAPAPSRSRILPESSDGAVPPSFMRLHDKAQDILLLFFTLRLERPGTMATPGNLQATSNAMPHMSCLTGTNGARLLARRSLTAALLALACFSVSLEPAASRQVRNRHSFRGFFEPSASRHHRNHRPMERQSDQKGPEVKKPVGPMFAVVSLADQHVSFYDANGLWERSGVSTGVPGHPTPAGIFTILEKERWHRSNIYSGAPMPFMQRLAWTGVAMHEGAVHEGHTASHGCIRMHAEFAKRLFAVTNAGQRVIVSPQDVTPADIVHAHLPQPKLQAEPLEAAADKSAAVTNSAVEPVALDSQAASQKAGPVAKLLNPGAFAQAMKAAAAAKAKQAIQTKKSALALLDSKSAEARIAARELELAEQVLRRAKAELEDAERLAAKAQGEEALQKAAERKAAAQTKLADSEKKVLETQEAKAAKDQDILSAQTSIRDADAAQVEAAAAAKQAERRSEPVSMFISRKTGRLYVRQATVHLFDVPIVIRDPERPIGTHLFIATRPSEDGTTLHWASLTPPAAVEVKVMPRSSRRGRTIHREEEAAATPPFPETAAGALDRIEIPDEAAQRIAGLLWTGATLIVSDVGMSGEGRFAMDFQILERTLIREW